VERSAVIDVVQSLRIALALVAKKNVA
jgi:hypothetical protein